MRTGNSIIPIPLLVCVGLSVAAHAVLFRYPMSAGPEATIQFEPGRTVLQFRLTPARPAPAIQITTPNAATPPHTEQPAEVLLPADPVEEASAPSQEGQQPPSAAEVGVITEAEAVDSIHPRYPRLSRLRGEEGIVKLMVQVSAEGNSGAISILQSSGYPRLDDAACRAVRATTFTPASRDGHPIDSETKLTFTFRLTDA